MTEALGKKSSLSKRQGWEEAGSEFYHENYSTDWDGFTRPSNTACITTLLPSKQNRLETCKKKRSCQDIKNSKYWQTTSAQTRHKHNEIQCSILPDLSQVLNDEEHIWEEVHQIKLLPVSMPHKIDLKLSLQSATKLRVQGFGQFKWKHRKAWKKLCLKWSELVTNLDLWQSSLKKIEGHFGTGVVAYFLFLRWLFFLNFLSFFFIFAFLVLPNILELKRDTTKCCNDSKNQNFLQFNQEFFQDSVDIYNILDLFQGTGILQNSLMFYGAFSNKTVGYFEKNTDADKIIYSLYYDLSLAYLFVTVFCFSIALIAIVKGSAHEFKDRLVNGKWQFYKHSNLVFGGWDFCIFNEKSGKMKHRALFNEVKFLLQSKRLMHEKKSRSKEYMYKLIFTRIFVNLIILSMLALSAFLIYFLLNITLKDQYIRNSNNLHQYKEQNSTRNGTNVLDELQESRNFLNFFFDFVPYIAIVCLNFLLPTIFNYLCRFEKYSPLFVVKISLFRTVFLRLSSLSILLSRFYFIILPQFQNQNQSCWETFVGQQLYKLLLTDFCSHLFVTFGINFPRALIARKVNNNFVKLIGEQEFELPKHVLDILYSQTICWLGSFYTPFLPAFATIFTFIMFFIKKFQCLVNSRPSDILYGASRSNSMFMLILLVSFFVAVMPVTYAIAEITPSLACGPFKGLVSIWDAPVSTFMKMPTMFKSFIFFFGTAGFAIPCFLFLTLLLYYFYAVSDANKNMVEVLKHQLVLEGHDKQFLLNRLSIFLSQDQDSNGKNDKFN